MTKVDLYDKTLLKFKHVLMLFKNTTHRLNLSTWIINIYIYIYLILKCIFSSSCFNNYIVDSTGSLRNRSCFNYIDYLYLSVVVIMKNRGKKEIRTRCSNELHTLNLLIRIVLVPNAVPTDSRVFPMCQLYCMFTLDI